MTFRSRIAVFAVLLVLCASACAQQKEQPKNPPAHSQPEVSATPPAEAHQAEQPKGMAYPGGAQKELIEASKEAAGEDETAEFKRSPSVQFVAHLTGTSLATAYWLCVGFNFAVVAALIIIGMKKALPAAFRDRTAAIKKALEEARKASEDANRRLGDVESRLAKLDQEIAALHGAAEDEARQEEQRIQAAAEEDRVKIVQAAEQEIAAAARSARAQLKSYAAELAVGLAEKKISIGATQDHELVRTFAQQLGKDGQ